jgi:hypothetical protein
MQLRTQKARNMKGKRDKERSNKRKEGWMDEWKKTMEYVNT